MSNETEAPQLEYPLEQQPFQSGKTVLGQSYLYTVKDIKQPRFFPPYDAVNDDVAVRHFFNMSKVPNSVFSTNPTDFELWRIGAFVSQTASVLLEDDLKYICNVADLLLDKED